MPGADDLVMRIYAAMAQKERELISGAPRWHWRPPRRVERSLAEIEATGLWEAQTRLRQHTRGARRRRGQRTGWRLRWTDYGPRV